MQMNDRLRRLIADEIDCCDAEEIDQCRRANVEERLNVLQDLKADTKDRIHDEDLRAVSNSATRRVIRLSVYSSLRTRICAFVNSNHYLM